MTGHVLLLLLGLEFKHLVADFLLQFRWMTKAKGSVFLIGGYAHSAVHSLSTLAVLGLFSVPLSLALALAMVEFPVHYLIDYSKAHIGKNLTATNTPRKYWALFGFDQFLHHLTYIGMIFIVVVWQGV